MAARYDIDITRRRVKVGEIERKAQLDRWNDYITFFTSKLLGAGGLTAGGLEMLAPDLLPLPIHEPAWVAAVGLALLTGKSILRLFAATDEALGRRK